MNIQAWRLLALIGAAILGGYAIATAFGIFLAGALPLPRGEAVVIGSLAGYAAYAVAIVWVFCVRRPGRAWLILMAGSLMLTTAGLALGSAGP